MNDLDEDEDRVPTNILWQLMQLAPPEVTPTRVEYADLLAMLPPTETIH